jgi:hypothetical protein
MFFWVVDYKLPAGVRQISIKITTLPLRNYYKFVVYDELI